MHPFLASCFDSYPLIGLNMVFKMFFFFFAIEEVSSRLEMKIMKMSCGTVPEALLRLTSTDFFFPLTQVVLSCHEENQHGLAVCSLKIHIGKTCVACPILGVFHWLQCFSGTSV